MITKKDIADRHPQDLICRTDGDYAELANSIYNIHHEELGFLESDEDIRNVCIGMALFFEDLHSGTRQFETFEKLYHRMYGRYMPFYDSFDRNSPEAELDAANFVLWLCISAERQNNIINPTNSGVRNMAREILALWNERKISIRPNDELADYLYCEETQEDASEVRNVLVWLESRSFLGRWYTNYNYEDDEFDVASIFLKASEGQQKLGHDCIGAFEHQAWPLSVKANHIYAEMVRLEMEDDDDEMAARIDSMRFKPLSLYHVMKRNASGVVLRDFRGEDFQVAISAPETLKASRKYSHIISAFFEYNGIWYSNCLSAWKNFEGDDYAEYVNREREEWSYFHDYTGQYEDYVKSRNGERLRFFQNLGECRQWVERDLGLNVSEILPDSLPGRKPFVAFFEPNGQITFMTNPMCIRHGDNRSYDKTVAAQEGLGLISERDSASPDLTMYLIEHDLVPDVALNDFRGREHGRQLLQENMDFLARCTRRDITTDKVCRRRTDLVFADAEIAKSEYESKLSFKEFVSRVSQEKSIRSSANKEWILVACDDITTIVRDKANGKEYSFSTKSLHNAHVSLKEKEIQIASLVQYVGRDCAPAATVVLYNVVGRGRNMHAVRKFVEKIFGGI